MQPDDAAAAAAPPAADRPEGPAPSAPEPLLRAALAQLTEAVIVADAAGRVTFVNDAAARMHGVAPLDVAPEGYAEAYQLFTEDGRPHPSTELPLARAVLHGETVVDARWRIRRPDGTEIVAVGSARPVFGPGGVQIGAVLTIRDDTARAAAAAAVRERDSLADRLRAAFEQTPVSTVVYDATGRPVAVNPAFERLWGAALADVPPDYSVLADPQLEAAGVMPRIRRAFAGEAVSLPPLRYEMRDAVGRGRALWTQAHLYPVRDAAGAVEQVVLTHENVTERMEAEAALAETMARAERMQALTAALSNASTVDEVAQAVVEHASAVFGAVGMVVARLSADGRELELMRAGAMPADVHEEWRRFPVTAPVPLAEVARTGEPIFLESRAAWEARYSGAAPMLEATGHHANAVLPLVADGRVLGVLGAAFDAPRHFDADARARALAVAQQCAQALERARLFEAERVAREAAERAADRAARLQTVTAALAATITTNDVVRAMLDHGLAAVGATAGVVCLLNERASEIDRVWALGYPEAGLEAFRKVALVAPLPPRDVARTREPVWVESPAQWLERYLPPGPGMDVAPAAAGLPLLAGDRLAGVMVLRFPTARHFSPDDRTQILSVASQCAQALERARLHEAERAARAEAEAANRAKSDFLAVMSHELRTPLNAIGGYAELLEMGIRGPVTDAQREDLARIQHSQRHLLGLINEVLNYAKLETGSIRYDVADVSVRDTLLAAEGLVAPQARAKGLALAVADCASDVLVRADPEKLRQILVNLLSNAVKFTDRGGRVDLACERHGGSVHVVVRDTGIGIPADQLERIFEPFVQVRADLTRTAEGTGLGLAISRDLARGMGGDLTARSVLGEGSAFTLILPGSG